MTDLTAIDVLIDPDEQAIERARKINARLLKSLPQGWALDDTHKPHITTLQRYVRTADLDKVYDAVEKILAETDMAALGYQAVKITHADWGFPGYGPTVLLVQVSPEVLFSGKARSGCRPLRGVGWHGGGLRRRCGGGDQPDHHQMGRGVRVRSDRQKFSEAGYQLA